MVRVLQHPSVQGRLLTFLTSDARPQLNEEKTDSLTEKTIDRESVISFSVFLLSTLCTLYIVHYMLVKTTPHMLYLNMLTLWYLYYH